MDLLLALDRAAPTPLRDQLYEGLRIAILDGRLRVGARLPATRALAVQLGVARFTVEDAYARLVAEGYLVGRRGSGTYVTLDAATPPARRDRSASPAIAGGPGRRAWSAWGERLQLATDTGGAASAHARPYVFRAGMPALDAFPHALWNRLRAREARSATPASRDYGPSAGHPALRAAIAGYLARSRGIACGPERVIVTSGTRQTLDLLARLWLDPGDTVAVEDPGYPAAHRVLMAAGARIVPIPVDADGLRVDLLRERTADVKLVYVTPSHQYPTGGVLSLARRWALLAWARERGALVVEDDYDGEFRYGARPVPALAGLEAADGGVVAYVGTFSKVLYPALRLGYVVLPSDMVDRFVAAKAVADHHAPTAEQAVLAAFIAESHFERHLARMRRLYAARQAALAEALASELDGIARRDPATTAAGLHLLVGFDVPFTEEQLVARAATAGVALDPAGGCYLAAAPPLPSALVGYAMMPEARIRDGVRALARALRRPASRRAVEPAIGWDTLRGTTRRSG